MGDRLQRHAGGAADTAVVVALQRDWQRLAGSVRLRARLRQWAKEDSALGFVDGFELVAAADDRPAGPDESCPALAGLVGRVPGDGLALRVAVQVMLPRWCALIDQIGGMAVKELAGLVVECGIYQIVACDPEEASTPIDYRLWSNTRRQVLRAVKRRRSCPEEPAGGVGELEQEAGPAEQQVCVISQLGPLADWVAETASLPERTAQLIVGTRVAGVSLQEAAAAAGQREDTVRHRRYRGEKRLRRRLMAAA